MSNSSFLIKKGVFVMRKHDALQKKKDTADSKKILRTSFQWLYAVIWFLFGFVFLFTVIFKISAFRINKGYETKTAFVLVSSIGYSPSVGDKVTVSSGRSGFLAQISALSGTEISFGNDKNNFANCIVYENKSYFSGDELKQVLENMKVPENCVLVTDITSENGYFRIGEIVPESRISGKAECFFYPFHMLGKPIDKLSEVY